MAHFYFLGLTRQNSVRQYCRMIGFIIANERRHIIKASDKGNIMKQLASIGISKAKLFPEVDMVSQFIKNDFGLNNEVFSSSLPKPQPSVFL